MKQEAGKHRGKFYAAMISRLIRLISGIGHQNEKAPDEPRAEHSGYQESALVAFVDILVWADLGGRSAFRRRSSLLESRTLGRPRLR